MKTPAALILLCSVGEAQSFVKYQNQALRATAEASTSQKTVKIIEGSSIGTCVCDITRNQCDAYCCCDSDCSEEVLEAWQAEEESLCANYVGDSQKPLTKCMDLRYIQDYNERSDKGMKVTEVGGELCVELDTGSSFSEYIMPLSSIQQFPQNAYSVSAQNSATAATTQTTYEQGQTLYQKLADQDKEFFTLLSAGSEGLCSEQASVKMLENTGQLSCKLRLQSGDIEPFCTSNLNPKTFVEENLRIMLGTSSQSLEITTRLVQDDQIVEAELQDSIFEPTCETREDVVDEDEGERRLQEECTCCCKQFVSSVIYKFNYDITDQGNYQIQTVTATVLLQDSASFQYADIEDGEDPFEVDLSFQAKFAEYYDESQETIKFSGAPGYLTGKPLFISEGFYNEGGSELVNSLGFQFQPVDDQGNCFVNEKGFDFEILEYPVSSLKFGLNSAYSCKTAHTFESLRDEGQNLDLTVFDAFLNKFLKVGKFGIIDLSKRADFSPVFKSGLDDLENQMDCTCPSDSTEEEGGDEPDDEEGTDEGAGGGTDEGTDEGTGEGTEGDAEDTGDADTGADEGDAGADGGEEGADGSRRLQDDPCAAYYTCKNVLIGLQVQIITSQVGYENNPQNYVAGALIEPIFNDLVFDDETTQKEQIVSVQVNFVKDTPETFDRDNLVADSMPSLPKDLFYPLSIVSSGAQILAVSMAILVVGLFN